MIINKSKEEIQAIRRSNQVVAQVLTELEAMVKPGIMTKELDSYADKRARQMGAILPTQHQSQD